MSIINSPFQLKKSQVNQLKIDKYDNISKFTSTMVDFGIDYTADLQKQVQHRDIAVFGV